MQSLLSERGRGIKTRVRKFRSLLGIMREKKTSREKEEREREGGGGRREREREIREKKREEGRVSQRKSGRKRKPAKVL